MLQKQQCMCQSWPTLTLHDFYGNHDHSQKRVCLFLMKKNPKILQKQSLSDITLTVIIIISSCHQNDWKDTILRHSIQSLLTVHVWMCRCVLCSNQPLNGTCSNEVPCTMWRLQKKKIRSDLNISEELLRWRMIHDGSVLREEMLQRSDVKHWINKGHGYVSSS